MSSYNTECLALKHLIDLLFGANVGLDLLNLFIIIYNFVSVGGDD